METALDRNKIKITGNGVREPQNRIFDIAVFANVEIEPLTARRSVTDWLISEVGNMIVGGTPQLIVSKQTVWRVPAVLTSTSKGVVGEVGTVDVDAETGEVKSSLVLKDQILSNVTRIVTGTASTTAG